jgi:hypothetical protein
MNSDIVGRGLCISQQKIRGPRPRKSFLPAATHTEYFDIGVFKFESSYYEEVCEHGRFDVMKRVE